MVGICFSNGQKFENKLKSQKPKSQRFEGMGIRDVKKRAV